ncbi:ABC transporter substrate-binding protein [Streptomyces xanthophaeus]
MPDWAKDSDGHWMLAYTGTIAFIVDKQQVKEGERPKSWHDLEKGTYTVAIGAVATAAQAACGVLAAAIAYKGDESDIEPGLQLFTKLAQQNRLSLANPTVESLEEGEIAVGVLWDFNALSYRSHIDTRRFEVLIPSDGSVTSGYATVINKYAKHPNAAKLAREFILSDAGQVNLAQGHARPIRADHVKLPPEVEAKLLSNEQYAAAQPIKDAAAWESTLRKLPLLWQEQVVSKTK